jgi:hypothetical protein
MAVQRLFTGQTSPGTVVVDGPTVQIVKVVALEAPKAAGLLSTIPDDDRVMVLEELLEHGAAAAMAAQTSAHVVQLEAKVAELSEQLRELLGDLLEDSSKASAEETQKLLQAHKEALIQLLTPLTDPDNKEGLPVRMAELLERVNNESLKRVEGLLQDGDQGVLAQAVKAIVKEIKETGLSITKELSARNALLRKSNLRGGRFEEVLAVQLPVLVRVVGRVEHTATTEGDKGGNAGDYLVTVEQGRAGETLSIAVEAKSVSKRMSPAFIRAELAKARHNRSAAAGILVAESREMVPGGAPLGQVSETDFFAVFDPETGDDTALACSLYMARVAAIAAATPPSGEGVDIAAAQNEVGQIRELLNLFSKMEGHHSRVEKEIVSARTVAADLRAEILARLRHLDAMLTA